MSGGRRNHKLRFSQIYTFFCGNHKSSSSSLIEEDQYSLQVGGPGFSHQVFVNYHDDDTIEPKVRSSRSSSNNNNTVSTTKYNLLTFIPKSLFEQFRRVANVYFLVSACLSCTRLTPFSSETFILPLLVVIGATMVKEGIEDWHRFQQDNEVNNRKVEVLLHDGDGNFDSTEWKNLRVGDVVKVTKDSFFPADLLLLSSSYEDGICYVETANLDGETNLKLKQKAVPDVSYAFRQDPRPTFKRFSCVINCEDPNSNLYTFVGTMSCCSGCNSKEEEDRDDQLQEERYPLSPHQLLLRDSKLRNTDYVYGAVIFTGHDTKVMRNATAEPHSKRSGIEKKMDKIIYFLLSVLVILSAIGSIFLATTADGDDIRYVDDDDDDGGGGGSISSLFLIITRWYLRPDVIATEYFDSGSTVLAASFFHFLSAMILYGFFIPISLYVSIEIVKILQTVFINQDIEMYHKDTDRPACARTSNLNEELGQVDTILSDKTGTLTSNSMDFVKCSIAGTPYGNGSTDPEHRQGKTTSTEVVIKGFNFKDDRLMGGNWVKKVDDDTQMGVIQMFLRVLAICHTAIPEVDDSGTETITTYEAESPDEAALVIAGREFGFKFSKRTQSSISVVELHPTVASSSSSSASTLQEKERSYELLKTLEFNSSRRRMSVVVRSEEGKLLLLSKGADSVMLERLAENGRIFEEKTRDHIKEYADAGLRTLVLAYRELGEEEYSNFDKIFTEARNSVTGDREENMDSAAELLEKDLILLGATAVEDKLQNGVPECIDKLAKAGIKIWVLTGDKMETAINVGFGCRLLRQGMKQIIITLETSEIKALEKEGNREAVVMVLASRASISKQINDGRKSILCSEDSQVSFSLVIDGKSLEYALVDDLKDNFLALATGCASVICCRSSPKQKALVTRLVKTGTGKTTLAIGDGANDVGMLQEADIGIGISGVEGMQAVMASDVAIAQFCFLERLLLVHGHWCYRRITSMVCYFFYKNVAFGFTLFLFEAYTSFSAQPAYNEWFLALYNVFFTSLPVIALGVFDQDVSARYCLKFPPLYREGSENLLFGWGRVLGWTFNGVLSAVTIFFFCTSATGNQAFTATGEVVDYEILGVIMYTCLVWVVNCQLALFVRYFTLLQHIFIWGGIALWYMFLLAYGSIEPSVSTTGFMVFVEECAPTASYWMLTLFVVIATLVPYFMYSAVQMWFNPMYHEKIQLVRCRRRFQDDPELCSWARRQM